MFNVNLPTHYPWVERKIPIVGVVLRWFTLRPTWPLEPFVFTHNSGISTIDTCPFHPYRCMHPADKNPFEQPSLVFLCAPSLGISVDLTLRGDYFRMTLRSSGCEKWQPLEMNYPRQDSAALNRDYVLLNSPSGERRILNNTVISSLPNLFHVAKIKRFFGTCKDFPYFFSYFSKKPPMHHAPVAEIFKL